MYLHCAIGWRTFPCWCSNINASESERMNRPAPVYTDEAIDFLCHYHWPGNVRELKNMVKRLIILQPGSSVSKNSIKQTFPVAMSITERPEGFSTREQAERSHIIKALTASNGTVGGKKGAARLLGMARSTLQYRIKKLQINPAEFLSH